MTRFNKNSCRACGYQLLSVTETFLHEFIQEQLTA
jgi:hypothetical protein